jgi:hypothetical protein
VGVPWTIYLGQCQLVCQSYRSFSYPWSRPAPAPTSVPTSWPTKGQSKGKGWTWKGSAAATAAAAAAGASAIPKACGQQGSTLPQTIVPNSEFWFSQFLLDAGHRRGHRVLCHGSHQVSKVVVRSLTGESQGAHHTRKSFEKVQIADVLICTHGNFYHIDTRCGKIHRSRTQKQNSPCPECTCNYTFTYVSP